jgi:hypothetical protein
MARSARDLFEEAMRLDPEERVTLMRLLSRTLTQSRRRASRTPGGLRSSAGWPSWTRARCRRSRGRTLERDCTAAEWRQLPSGSPRPPSKRRNRRSTGTSPEILTPPVVFAESSGTPSMLWLEVRGPGLAMGAVRCIEDVDARR